VVDEELVQRVRAAVGDVVASPDGPAGGGRVTERRMFGGVAFLLDGAMAVAVSGRGGGGLMVRVPPEDRDALLEHPGVGAVLMRDAQMRGWVLVEAAGVDDAALRGWARRGCAVAASRTP
jgi:TfoX/Sxy family transcriptional regulator of competence genes